MEWQSGEFLCALLYSVFNYRVVQILHLLSLGRLRISHVTNQVNQVFSLNLAGVFVDKFYKRAPDFRVPKLFCFMGFEHLK
jgi:hypothetical protein